jgi:predicted O-methyltransferase YrrM
MSITQFLNHCGFFEFEGYSQQVRGQVNDLLALTRRHSIEVMEIGFNAGHSAELFLHNNPYLTLTSFDLGRWDYIYPAKNYIDYMYPNRHTLIMGDSTVTVPKYISDNPGKKFDVIFIDGGHEYDTAKADLENCFHLAHKDTIIILDDTMFTPGWEAGHTHGPSRVWIETVSVNKIKEMAKKDYQEYRGMSWGRYVFPACPLDKN